MEQRGLLRQPYRFSDLGVFGKLGLSHRFRYHGDGDCLFLLWNFYNQRFLFLPEQFHVLLFSSGSPG
jgi:hypothetical protein